VNPENFNQIAVSADHLRLLLEQIECCIPTATVWAFGSRVKGTHLPASDLDLAVHCDKKNARNGIPKLKDALEESNLPFKVQILDFNRLPKNMQENIKEKYVEIYRSRKPVTTDCADFTEK
jgi:predicted nucleotidyltransferase